ncbi:MAG: GTPase [archaeon]|nr:GTPase [archaeon]
MPAGKSYYRKDAKIVRGHNQHRMKYPDIARQVILQSDIVIEILDSRFWRETRNIESEKFIKEQGKRIIFVINKSDLIDRKEVIKNMGETDIYPFVFVSTKERRGSSELMERIKIEAKKFDKEKIYVGVIGYPNTGKSSVINLLKGSSSARVSSESGFTKGMQKVKITDKILLIDTPGVIPESEDSNIKEQDLFKHALINTRTWDKIKNPEAIVNDFMLKYPKVLEEYYDIPAEGDSEVLLEKLGKKKNFILKKGEIDNDRTARLILRDFQEGKIKV